VPVVEARDVLDANAHTAQNWDGHFVACRKDGSAFDAYVSFLNMLDPEGNRAAIRVMVTERRRLFAEHHDGQTLRVVAENSFASVMLLNRSGVIQYCSPAAERISGYTPQERVGGTIFDSFSAQPRGVPQRVRGTPRASRAIEALPSPTAAQRRRVHLGRRYRHEFAR